MGPRNPGAPKIPYSRVMGAHAYWLEAIEDFIFAALFFLTAIPLARFLYRHTRCLAAAKLVSIGMFTATVGLTLLGMSAWKIMQFDPESSSPYANAAFIFQIGGACIMGGALVFTNIYAKKLIASGALDPSLRSSPLGLRSRRLDEASLAEFRARVAVPLSSSRET